MFGKQKLKDEITRLNYRIADLEERLCPCEQHDWVIIGEILVWNHPTDPDSVYEYKCKRCGKKARYTATKELVGIGCDFPFHLVNDWYDYQNDFINSLQLTEMPKEALYTEKVKLYEVLLYKKKRNISIDAEISLYPSKITVNTECDSYSFDFDKMSATSVLGKNKLNLYFDGKVYQIKGNKRFCALKYVNFYYRYKNIVKGNENERERNYTFLGL